MDWCVNFPKETYLTYRPSLRKACGQHRPSARFLSYLLFRASIREEAKIEAQNLNEVRRLQGLSPDQDATITIYRTQGQIVADMDNEISDRTLRDEAIPCLIELSYLTIEEFKGNKQYTAYTIHPAAIQRGIDHPENIPHFKTMAFYQNLQRVRKYFRTEKSPDGSEIFPNGSEKSPSGLSVGFGKVSEPKTGRKVSSEAVSEGVFSPPKNLKDNNKDNSVREGDLLSQSRTPTPSFLSEENLIPPALTLPQRDNTQARMDETEQGMIYMSLSAEVRAGIIYLSEQKYRTTFYQDEGEPVFVVKDPDTKDRYTYSTEEFLQFIIKVKQHSAELDKRAIAREMKTIFEDVFPEIPHTPPLQATNSGGVSPAATTPLQASNTPSVDEPVIDTASSSSVPISGSPLQEMAFSEDEVATGQSESKQASGVSHSQGTLRNAALETSSEDTPVETTEPEKGAGKGKGKGRTTRPRSKKAASFSYVVPEELAPRVEKVKEFLNSWRQKKLNDPEECFIFDDEALKAICELFQGKPPTDKKLEQICEKIWNEPRNPRTGYYPREHMTVPTICKQYKGHSMVLAAGTTKRAEQPAKNNYIIDEDEDQGAVVGIAQLRRLQGRA